MTYGLDLVTAPAEEPLTVAEAKEHLRVTFDDDDTLIDSLITAARKWLEEETYRQLVTATWDLVLDRFPSGQQPIRIPRAPLASVTSITYTDIAGDSQTLTVSEDYVVSATREPGIIRPAYAQTWPTARDAPDVVTVRFVAGYGDADDVPEPIVACLKLLIGQMYEFREELAERALHRLPNGAQRLIELYSLGDELMEYGAAGTLDRTDRTDEW